VSIGERLEGKQVCICAGSGGVGKTTTSAALALGLAAEGRKVAVVTIDPARRLASSLGLPELGNEPVRIAPERFEAHGLQLRGELWAMMLDAKRTFDDLVDRLAPDAAAREAVLANRIYSELSSAVAGSQEFSAVVKLYELHRSGDFDVLVLDTPPSRNALDFLDAPIRLTQFLEGRALRMFLAPTGFASRVVGRGTGVVFSVLKRLTGVDLLEDLSVFFRVLGGMLDGFRQRAVAVGALLRDPVTGFVIVTSPEPEPVEEAVYFRSRLRRAGMPFAALVVNRVHPEQLLGVDAERVGEELAPHVGAALARRAAANLADFQVLAERDRRSVARLAQELDEPHPILVPHLDVDVHDAEGLVHIAHHLFAG
jgi:anion-transporting  ArsA/GET3 family ATPase